MKDGVDAKDERDFPLKSPVATSIKSKDRKGTVSTESERQKVRQRFKVPNVLFRKRDVAWGGVGGESGKSCIYG